MHPRYTINLKLKAQNITSQTHTSPIAPLCSIRIRDNKGDWTYAGQTEAIRNDRNPNWKTSISVLYYPNSPQIFRAELFHQIDEEDQHTLGVATAPLQRIVHGEVQTIDILNLQTVIGQLIIDHEVVLSNERILQVQFRARGLDKKDFFGKSDPYFRLFRLNDDGNWRKIFTSKYVKQNLNPIWEPIEFSLYKLCYGDWDRSIKLDVWDWDKYSRDDFIGEGCFTLNDLVVQDFQLNIINPKKKSKRKYTNSGVVEILNHQFRQVYGIMDYLRGGTEFNLVLGIDFSLSPRDGNLHEIQGNQMNIFEQAIYNVCSMLEVYDNDLKYPVYGMGAIPSWDESLGQCFAVNKNESNPYVKGVDGILQNYRKVLNEIQQNDQIDLQFLLQRILTEAQNVALGSQYTVLVIFTYGIVQHIQRTVRLIVQASHLPISIILVGLGTQNFSQMILLDSDDYLLTDADGNKALRDIVQFVPYREVSNDSKELFKQVMYELPQQLNDFMFRVGLEPRENY